MKTKRNLVRKLEGKKKGKSVLAPQGISKHISQVWWGTPYLSRGGWGSVSSRPGQPGLHRQFQTARGRRETLSLKNKDNLNKHFNCSRLRKAVATPKASYSCNKLLSYLLKISSGPKFHVNKECSSQRKRQIRDEKIYDVIMNWKA